MIPFNDLRPAIEPIRADIDAAIKRVVDSGVFLNGPEVEAFEHEWAAYCGQRYCVACASGTDALMLATRVFTAGSLSLPANTCRFSKVGIERGDANIPFFYDVDERGYCDSQHIVAVLLYGRQKHPYSNDSHVMFDACQAHGWTPPRNALVAWSGYPTKNLGGFGDCGWVTTGCDSESARMRAIAATHHSRMSEINAAVLRTKLPHLDHWNAERHELAEVYYDNLPDWAEPACRPSEPTNHHIFAVLVDRRDALEAHLLKNGVGCRVHYREPLAKLPGAIRWCSRTLSLPMYPGLTREQVLRVCDTIRSFA